MPVPKALAAYKYEYHALASFFLDKGGRELRMTFESKNKGMTFLSRWYGFRKAYALENGNPAIYGIEACAPQMDLQTGDWYVIFRDADVVGSSALKQIEEAERALGAPAGTAVPSAAVPATTPPPRGDGGAAGLAALLEAQRSSTPAGYQRKGDSFFATLWDKDDDAVEDVGDKD